jgi:putative protease
MLPYLDKLISLGVKSLKIEGRLRNESYISTATSVYRNAIDELYEFGAISNINEKTKNLKEVFDSIFVQEKNPEVINPSIVLTFTNNGAYEVGT